MDRFTWEIIYLCLDIVGLGIFAILFCMFLPKVSSWNYYILAISVLLLAIALVFFWLLCADLGSLLKIEWLATTASFPARGIGLRLLLIAPGLGLVHGFKQ